MANGRTIVGQKADALAQLLTEHGSQAGVVRAHRPDGTCGWALVLVSTPTAEQDAAMQAITGDDCLEAEQSERSEQRAQSAQWN